MLDTSNLSNKLVIAAALALASGRNLEPIPPEAAELIKAAMRASGRRLPRNVTFTLSMASESQPGQISDAQVFYDAETKALYWETKREGLEESAA